MNGMKQWSIRLAQLSTQRVIGIGFILVLALMTLLIAGALLRMVAIKDRMQAIVERQNVKLESVYQMRSQARERYNSLLQMAVVADPFEQDEEFIRFNQHAADFIVARDALLAAGMAEGERAVWEKARQLVREDEVLHDRVLALAQSDRRAEAIQLLLRQVRPMEVRILAQFNSLIELQREASRRALVEAEAEYHRALVYMASLAALAVLFSFFIARAVIRRSRRSETELAEQKERALAVADQLSWAASHDALTGLSSRLVFERQLTELIQDARLRDSLHVLLYVDLDQFKVVNDTCGHIAGDELLKQVALILPRHVRSGDTVARLGGDEFGLLLASCPVAKAVEIAEALLADLNGFRFGWQDKLFHVGASIGLAEIGPASRQLTEVLSAADTACYLAKEKGRNRVWVYQADDAETLQRQGEMQWLPKLSQALKDERFELHFQNIMRVGEPKAGPALCEVLVRMRDEAGRLVPPMAFIPAAERYGLVQTLDRWVLGQTLAWLGGQAPDQCPTLMVNVSAPSMADESFLNFVVERINAAGIVPERIGFEITETAAVSNLAKATRFIQVLRGMGCQVALDDFGSGMASFAYLKNLPVSLIKIDGSFVADMMDDPLDFVIVESTCRIAKQMGLKVVAEHVTCQQALASLHEMGADYAQGYLLHHPERLAA
ncbi:diguanylate cyclase (GGDEF)-like protein [Sulfuritortus calidifontis]|uniref:Diguanylate cyclase (GGDEF)-like protein n=2 Tax=Sulfuritortus calidifontis TaxID=1914471 RepID=A0A4R3JTL2_9PROT|nr:diguanylate cyclase (GGDEF)-like protein [Sulfuritortus calidifontis]